MPPRVQTTSATLSHIEFASGEIYATPAATQRLLDDAQIDLVDWLTQAIRDEFARQEGIALLSGDGTNKPRDTLTYAPGGANENTTPPSRSRLSRRRLGVDALVDFAYRLAAPYRQNATWLMSSLTAAALTKLKDADGTLIWQSSLIVGQPDTLLGRPVEIDEGMPGPAAGNLAIALADSALDTPSLSAPAQRERGFRAFPPWPSPDMVAQLKGGSADVVGNRNSAGDCRCVRDRQGPIRFQANGAYHDS